MPVSLLTRPNLVERAGGEAGIEAILRDLYGRLFADLMVGFLFEGHDRERIIRVQTGFTRRLLGETTAPYEGQSIPAAHAALPILPGHFDRRHHLLRQVLEAHAVDSEVREAWLRLDQALRPAVLRAGEGRIEELARGLPPEAYGDGSGSDNEKG
jgi:hemoglobin